MKIPRHFYVAIAILTVAVILGEVYFRFLVPAGGGESRPLAKPLASIPRGLGDWRAEKDDDPIDPATLLVIGAMDTLRRHYTLDKPGGSVRLDLYIAYFGGVRGTAPHHPDICMPGAGYDQISNELIPLKVDGFGDVPLTVHKDVFDHPTDGKRLVVWWEYVHGENVASRTMQRLKWVLPKAFGGERGSILQVQVLAKVTGDPEEMMVLVNEFVNRLGPHLRDVLPKSAPAAQSAARSDHP